MDIDGALQLLDAIICIEVVFIDVINHVVSLPSLRGEGAGLWLLCLQLVHLLTLLVQILPQVSLLPLQGEEPALLEFHFNKSFIDLFFEGLGHREGL